MRIHNEQLTFLIEERAAASARSSAKRPSTLVSSATLDNVVVEIIAILLRFVVDVVEYTILCVVVIVVVFTFVARVIVVV